MIDTRSKIAVLITASNDDEAKLIATQLVEKKLAACVNIIPSVRSIYRWEGKIEDEKEILLIAKTSMDKFDSLQSAVLALHSYSTPEIIALPIVAGYPEYLRWMDKNL